MWSQQGYHRNSPQQTSTIGSFIHEVEGLAYCKVTESGKYPLIGAYVYNDRGVVLGVVDDVMGPITDPHFTIKCNTGVVASSFKENDKFSVEVPRIWDIANLVLAGKNTKGRQGGQNKGRNGPQNRMDNNNRNGGRRQFQQRNDRGNNNGGRRDYGASSQRGPNRSFNSYNDRSGVGSKFGGNRRDGGFRSGGNYNSGNYGRYGGNNNQSRGNNNSGGWKKY